MNIGQLVLLIGTDGFMPPLGSVGVIVEGLDGDGDYGVAFDGFPCPVGPETYWYAHSHWLVPLDPLRMREHELEIAA